MCVYVDLYIYIYIYINLHIYIDTHIVSHFLSFYVEQWLPHCHNVVVNAASAFKMPTEIDKAWQSTPPPLPSTNPITLTLHPGAPDSPVTLSRNCWSLRGIGLNCCCGTGYQAEFIINSIIFIHAPPGAVAESVKRITRIQQGLVSTVSG